MHIVVASHGLFCCIYTALVLVSLWFLVLSFLLIFYVLQIHTNGYISLSGADGSPSNMEPVIKVMLSDVDTTRVGSIFYG